jgi:phosphoglycolate phosphatase
MKYRAVLFDLDGTLLDTLADIAISADAVLVRFGFPAHGTHAYRRFVGEGLQMLFTRALPPGKAEAGLLAECGAAFREVYEQNWNRFTAPYEGIEELLDALEARSLKMAVLSNKPDRFTRLCVKEYFPGGSFQAVLGQRDGHPRKPDPAAAGEIARLLDVPPAEFVYVGDTPTDVETAQGAGMLPVGVRWGFRPAEELVAAGAKAILERPIQLVDCLLTDLPTPG